MPEIAPNRRASNSAKNATSSVVRNAEANSVHDEASSIHLQGVRICRIIYFKQRCRPGGTVYSPLLEGCNNTVLGNKAVYGAISKPSLNKIINKGSKTGVGKLCGNAVILWGEAD